MFPATGPEPPPSYVDNAPTLTSNDGEGGTQGTWSGTVEGNHAEWTGGAVRYTFPATTEDFDVADYDFFEIEYTGGAGGVILKQFDTGVDFGFVSNQYPSLSAEGTLQFEIRGAGTSGGVALQRNNGDATITVTKVTFTKGTRYPITFALGDYDGTDPAPTSPAHLVDGTKVGPLPAAPFWSGKLFAGWKKGDAVITSATDVDSTFNNAVLTALWDDEPTVSNFTVLFEDANKVVWESTATVTGNSAGNSYTLLNDSGKQYGPYAVFKITLPANVRLAYFDTVTFTYTGVSGDVNYKDVNFIALPNGNGGYQSGANNGAVSYGKVASGSVGTSPNTANLTINIDKSKAFANLPSNEIWIGFYIHAGATTTANNNGLGAVDSVTSYTISNVILSQTP